MERFTFSELSINKQQYLLFYTTLSTDFLLKDSYKTSTDSSLTRIILHCLFVALFEHIRHHMGHVWPCERPLNSLGLEGKKLSSSFGKEKYDKEKNLSGQAVRDSDQTRRRIKKQ